MISSPIILIDLTYFKHKNSNNIKRTFYVCNINRKQEISMRVLILNSFPEEYRVSLTHIKN